MRVPSVPRRSGKRAKRLWTRQLLIRSRLVTLLRPYRIPARIIFRLARGGVWCGLRIQFAWGFGGREGARTPDLLVANDKLAVQDVHKVLSVQQNALSGRKLLRAFFLAHWTPKRTPQSFCDSQNRAVATRHDHRPRWYRRESNECFATVRNETVWLPFRCDPACVPHKKGEKERRTTTIDGNSKILGDFSSSV